MIAKDVDFKQMNDEEFKNLLFNVDNEFVKSIELLSVDDTDFFCNRVIETVTNEKSKKEFLSNIKSDLLRDGLTIKLLGDKLEYLSNRWYNNEMNYTSEFILSKTIKEETNFTKIGVDYLGIDSENFPSYDRLDINMSLGLAKYYNQYDLISSIEEKNSVIYTILSGLTSQYIPQQEYSRNNLITLLGGKENEGAVLVANKIFNSNTNDLEFEAMLYTIKEKRREGVLTSYADKFLEHNGIYELANFKPNMDDEKIRETIKNINIDKIKQILVDRTTKFSNLNKIGKIVEFIVRDYEKLNKDEILKRTNEIKEILKGINYTNNIYPIPLKNAIIESKQKNFFRNDDIKTVVRVVGKLAREYGLSIKTDKVFKKIDSEMLRAEEEKQKEIEDKIKAEMEEEREREIYLELIKPREETVYTREMLKELGVDPIVFTEEYNTPTYHNEEARTGKRVINYAKRIK